MSGRQTGKRARSPNSPDDWQEAEEWQVAPAEEPSEENMDFQEADAFGAGVDSADNSSRRPASQSVDLTSAGSPSDAAGASPASAAGGGSSSNKGGHKGSGSGGSKGGHKGGGSGGSKGGHNSGGGGSGGGAAGLAEPHSPQHRVGGGSSGAQQSPSSGSAVAGGQKLQPICAAAGAGDFCVAQTDEMLRMLPFSRLFICRPKLNLYSAAPVSVVHVRSPNCILTPCFYHDTIACRPPAASHSPLDSTHSDLSQPCSLQLVAAEDMFKPA